MGCGLDGRRQCGGEQLDQEVTRRIRIQQQPGRLGVQGRAPHRAGWPPWACRRPRSWLRPALRCGAGAAHVQQAARAVVAHAGEDDADRVGAGAVRHRLEQHVDRGLVAVDQRAVAHRSPRTARRCAAVACGARPGRSARGRAARGRRPGPRARPSRTGCSAARRQAAVKRSGMCCTITMPGVVRGRPRSTASMACTPPVELPMATMRSVVSAMAPALPAAWRPGGAPAAVAVRNAAGAAVATAWPHGAHPGAGGRTAATRPLDGSLRKSRRPSLGLVTNDTAPSDRPAAWSWRRRLGERGAHHHRRRPLGHDLAQEADAVHARHLHVQHHHVGPARGHLGPGEQRVAGGGDHVDAAGREQVGQVLAHHGGVVDHDGGDAWAAAEGGVAMAGSLVLSWEIRYAGGRAPCRCRGAWSTCRWPGSAPRCGACLRPRPRRRAGSRSGRSATSPARCCVRRR
jgi:hypothetical protein